MQLKKYSDFISESSNLDIDDKRFVIKNGILSLIKHSFKNEKEIIVPEGVTRIYHEVFNGSKAKKIVLPTTLQYIGKWCFINCFNLQELNLPDSIIEIDEYAFTGIGTSGLSGLHEIILPKYLKKISKGLFQNSHLYNIQIPNSVEEIGNFAFNHCYNLSNIVIPNSVKKIGTTVFQNSHNLKDITLSNSLIEIPNHSFFACKNLQQIVIPKSVNKIKGGAFTSCHKLNHIIIENPNCVIEKNSLTTETPYTQLSYKLTHNEFIDFIKSVKDEKSQNEKLAELHIAKNISLDIIAPLLRSVSMDSFKNTIFGLISGKNYGI